MQTKGAEETRNFKATPNRREHIRFAHDFLSRLSKPGTNVPIRGVTENLSQGGAFIRMRDSRSFQTNERAVVTIFLPPTFSGQNETIGLQGAAVITRVDHANGGIGLRFIKSFKQFDRI